MTTTPNFYTLPDIARALGVTERRAEYAAKLLGIQPIRRIGIIRLFDEAAFLGISKAIRETDARRKAVQSA